MDDGLQRQYEIWATWTPAQRIHLMGRMSATVLAMRDWGLRQRHPDATAPEMRQLRIEATLAESPSRPLG